MVVVITRTVEILIFPQFQLLTAVGPIAAFEAAARACTHPPYRLRVVAPAAGPVISSSGVQLVAEKFSRRAVDTLIVAGGRGTREASPQMLKFIGETARRARRTTSVCSGAFLLAESGLLKDRRATTHWERATEFARTYPQVLLEPDRIFTRDGTVWTSAGISAGIDLALALVAEDLGEEVAKRAAQQLVVHYRRPGGQSQFSAFLPPERHQGRFSAVLEWARERLDAHLPVERLAERVAMSPRHFARAFVVETGTTPAKAIERLRLGAARERVEGGAEPTEAIAARIGFGDPERMRRAFIRAFGQPPQALRRSAKSAAYEQQNMQRKKRSKPRVAGKN
jgi:transcriptional regulator GlxA family with amidase domain